MVPLSWLLFSVLVTSVAGAAAWLLILGARRVARARRRAARWTHFVDHCPSGTLDEGALAYPLVSPPGPSGELSVQPEGLCVRLDAYVGRTFWLAWDAIQSLDPGQSGGAMLRAGGVEMHLSAEACRAVWDAKARVGRSRPAQPPTAGLSSGRAATAS
ncbi:MAG TPA: hypothetical protein VF594_01325 [Rubricoccaceae bacterium]|jgi:hypothetical protein